MAWYRGSQEAVEFRFGNRVTFARSAFQPAAIDDGDIAPLVANEAGTLQSACRSRNAGPLASQHHGQKLLRQQERIRSHAIWVINSQRQRRCSSE
jgi:hypothetical protein